MEKINIDQKFELFSERWRPKIIAGLNDSYIKLGRIKGEFVWHDHKNEDEMFLVIDGVLDIMFKDKTVTLNKGEFIVIPKGVMHKPFSKDEVKVMLIELKSTVNTGDEKSDLTQEKLEWI
jgi:mannose-6-phosphate isomerase-like protein (cupin superfamily)